MDRDLQIIGLLQELAGGVKRLEERMGAVEARLERHEHYFELIQMQLVDTDRRLTAVEQGVAGLDGRLGSVETRLAAVEVGLGSLRTEVRERFEGTDGRLRVLAEGFQFLEGRTAAQIAPIDLRLSAVEQQMRSAQVQLGRMESNNVHLGLRLEEFGEDVRQRFRDLNERLAPVA